MIITIDGPVASGKSSVALLLAERLSVYYLYTGLLYRAVAFVLVREMQKRVEDFSTLTSSELSFIADISYNYEGTQPQVLLGDRDITVDLYDSTLDQPSSIISANKFVRDALLALQRDVAQSYDLIADGRDTGSVVFPNADYKFYFTASVDVRARRLLNDPKRGGSIDTMEAARAAVIERDKRDMERDVAPLIEPEGALVIDTSEHSIEDTVRECMRYIEGEQAQVDTRAAVTR